jgi:hypothetical protein
MPTADLEKFLNSIRNDLQIPPLPTEDFSIKDGNYFASVDWTRERSQSVSSGVAASSIYDEEDDYFIADTEDGVPENDGDLLDSFLASLKAGEDYPTTTLPASVPLTSKTVAMSEMSCLNGSIFSKEMFSANGIAPSLASLDDLTSVTSLIPFVKGPFLLPVPALPTEESLSIDEYPSSLITKLFQGIPSNSWILPYILVGAATLAEQNEQKRLLCAESDVCLSPNADFFENFGEPTGATPKASAGGHAPPFPATPVSTPAALVEENYGDIADDELDEKQVAVRKKQRHPSGSLDDSHGKSSQHDHSVSEESTKDKHHKHKHTHRHHTHRRHPDDTTVSDVSDSEGGRSDKEHKHHKHKHHHGIGHIFHRKQHSDDERDHNSPRDETNPSDSEHHKEHKHKHHHGIGHIFHRKHKDDGELDDSHLSAHDEVSPSDSDHPHKEHKHKHKHGIGHIFHRKQHSDDERDHSSPRDETNPSDSEHHKEHKHHHGIGHIFHRKHKDGDDSTAPAPVVEGDFILSHNEKGVFVSRNKPRAVSQDNMSDAESTTERMIQRMPKFMQHLFLFPNFDDLGTVFIRPLVDTIWVPRHLYLWDNYLFETIPHSDDNLPLGYANLSGGTVVLKNDKKLKRKRFISLVCLFILLSSSSLSSHSLTNHAILACPDIGKNMKNQPNEPGHHLRLSFLVNSTKTSKKVELLLCGRDRISTEILHQKLFTAVNLGIENMYDYDPQAKPLGVGKLTSGEGTEDQISSYLANHLLLPCGVGRYARVVRAVNRHLREVITHNSSAFLSQWSQSVDELSSETMGSHPSAAGLSSSPPTSTSVPSSSTNSAPYVPGQCALKLVNKTEFWNQVKNGLERKDTLVREVLAQSHILNSLVQSSNGGNQGGGGNDNSSLGSAAGYDEVSLYELELPIVVLNGMLETRDEFVMDMELMHSGDLYEKLVENGSSFKELQVKHITIQLVQAVALCQANGIAHRDIKLSNITFPEKLHQEFASGGHDKHKPMQIKLADFGMAGFVNKEGYLWGRCGTPGAVPSSSSSSCFCFCPRRSSLLSHLLLFPSLPPDLSYQLL